MTAGRRARARARDKVTFHVEERHPGTPSKRPATAGRSQLCPAELSASSPSHLRASLPAAPSSPPPPLSQPLRLRGTVPGAPVAASASALPAARQPPSSHAWASALPPQRQRGELGVTGLWPPGADRTGTDPHGADARRRGKEVRISAGTGACPRHTNSLALTSSLRLPSPPGKSSAELPRAGRVHSPPKGSSCRAGACARAQLATSHLPPPGAPESPQQLTWPWRGARAEDQGVALASAGARLPTPSPGPSAALHSLGPPSSEVLAPPVAGVSLAGALTARSVPRGGARRRPPRPEADSSGAAPPASPESPRWGPPHPLPSPASWSPAASVPASGFRVRFPFLSVVGAHCPMYPLPGRPHPYSGAFSPLFSRLHFQTPRHK